MNPDSDSTPRPGLPRWVKISGLITLALVVLVIGMMLIGGHSPGDHSGHSLGVRLP